MGSPPHPSTSSPVRVAPATANELVSHGLRSAFDPFASRVELVAPGDAARADVVVLDTTGIPEPDLVSAVASATSSGRPVIVLSDEPEPRMLLRVLRAGVRGYVGRRRDARELVDDVVAVASGDLVLDAATSSRAALLASRLLDVDRPPAELLGLSDREVEVLSRLDSGATAREIGAELFVSHETVRSHLKRIYRKLGVHDRAGAIRRAREEGVIAAEGG